jgi:uncharacterized protein with HEPN domain
MKEDKPYILHIKDAINKIEIFTKGIDYRKFIENDMIQSAVIRQIEIIGEASNKLGSQLKDAYLEIPWVDIIGMRHKLIHDYFGVDLKKVWGTIKKDLPNLKKNIERILKKLNH